MEASRAAAADQQIPHRGVDHKEAPVVQHEEVTISMPRAGKGGTKAVNEKDALRVYFDGRCVKKLGAGGFIAFAPDGELLGGKALYYGQKASSNNEAEAEALLSALKWVEEAAWNASEVVVMGDSLLIVQFINRVYNPRVNSLVQRVAEAQRIRRASPVPIHVLFVPRERNLLADWLSRCGTAYQEEKDITELAPNLQENSQPPFKPRHHPGHHQAATKEGQPEEVVWPGNPHPTGQCRVCGEQVVHGG